MRQSHAIRAGYRPYGSEHQRPGAQVSNLPSLIGGAAANLALNPVQLPDTRQGLGGQG